MYMYVTINMGQKNLWDKFSAVLWYNIKVNVHTENTRSPIEEQGSMNINESAIVQSQHGASAMVSMPRLDARRRHVTNPYRYTGTHVDPSAKIQHCNDTTVYNVHVTHAHIHTHFRRYQHKLSD